MNWDNDTMVTDFDKKKFLFDYVADMLKGTYETKTNMYIVQQYFVL